MESPFPPTTSAAGGGSIVARLLPEGGSGLEAITYQYPLKLISPSGSAEEKSALVFLLSYGGGLVGGDTINLSVDVRRGARLSLVTQGHTKIFKAADPGIVTRQTLDVHIAEGAGLCLLPDPVQPFEGSNYQQTQIFRLAPQSSLCLLDWVTQGRTARGENWSLSKWTGRNEVWVSPKVADGGREAAAPDRLLVRDTVILDGDQRHIQIKTLRDTMHNLSVFGTLILRGPLTKSLGDFFLSEFALLPRLGARDFRSAEARANEEEKRTPLEKWRAERQKNEMESRTLWSAANVRGCIAVKFGATTVEAGRVWIGSMIAKEGSLAEQFGSQALMCIR
ncbi:uncharacterized protein E0L32_011167 [Thyridium curvatum]|uniref:Urease accessory protein UreD n=1 Tax=Thyridium curvatum TaxID=1093900 RepID=A0A507AIF9_9PEZI|nr:uncharacterized protein E0L32_011167 [Thyridium curvatum]TPX06943.1 hypothetical protein E0L32_011167 [Thyridium curvatum]